MKTVHVVNDGYVADHDYGPDEVEKLRNDVIKFRDDALGRRDFRCAIVLSLVVAIIATLKREVWPDS